MAIVVFYDLPADGQSDTRSFVFCHAVQAFERRKNLIQIFLLNPNPLIFHTEHPSVVFLLRGYFNAGRRGLRGKLDRIADEVLKQLGDQCFVASNCGHGLANDAGMALIYLCGQILQRSVDTRVKFDVFQGSRHVARFSNRPTDPGRDESCAPRHLS